MEDGWNKAPEQPHAAEGKFLWVLMRAKKVVMNFWAIMPPKADAPTEETL
jgi:hypothetical protein